MQNDYARGYADHYSNPGGNVLGGAMGGAALGAASKLPVPRKEELQFKKKDAWRYIGKGMDSVDLTDMCTGKAIYGMDARLDGMVYAVWMHSAEVDALFWINSAHSDHPIRGIKQKRRQYESNCHKR